MSKNIAFKILEHPDCEEIIAKLIIGLTYSEISEWLKDKYTLPSESKLILSEKSLKIFKDDYLDIYNHIKDDMLKITKHSPEEQLSLAIKNNKAYKNKIMELASQEVDIKRMITNMIVAIETRASQVFDHIQEDPVNFKRDRILIEWFDTLGNILEKYHKIVIAPPEQIVQHNVTLQVVDKHISVFHDVIKEVLSQMDLETSLYFMEIFNQKMNKLKISNEKEIPIDMRLAEAKLINETIDKKINE